MIYLRSVAEGSSPSHFDCVQTAEWAWSDRMGGVHNPEMGGEIKRQAFPKLVLMSLTRMVLTKHFSMERTVHAQKQRPVQR